MILDAPIVHHWHQQHILAQTLQVAFDAGGSILLPMASMTDIQAIPGAAKPYIDHERMIHRDDDTLFSEFEKLAKLWRRFDPEINDDALRKFLEDEKHLRVD